MIPRVVATFLLLSTQVLGNELKNLTEVYTWNTMKLGFEKPEDEQAAKDSGHNSFPVDVAVANLPNGEMVYITIPMFSEKSSYSLAYIPRGSKSSNPTVYPYPSYDIHNRKCKGIISAERVTVNECNQMWVIDSGMINRKQICPPTIHLIDLETDEIILRYRFPSTLYQRDKSLFINIIADTADPRPIGNCKKSMVYVSDDQAYGLLVFDAQRRVAWRIENKYMRPDEKWAKHTIAGQSFNITSGIHALALSPRKWPHERMLYFHCLNSDKEISVPLNKINNQSFCECNSSELQNSFQVVGTRGVQSAAEAIDSEGNLYAGTDDPLFVFTWNIAEPYTIKNVVANNSEELQFISGMTIVRTSKHEEEVWMLSSRYQKYVTHTLDPNDTNYRIMRAKIKDLQARVS